MQWGIDFLENLVEITSSSTDQYCLKLLAGEHRCLQEESVQLVAVYCRNVDGILVSEGLPGGRVFVLRLLLSTLPASIHCRQEQESVLRQFLEMRLKQLHDYLKSLKFTAIRGYSKYPLIFKCLNILKSKGISPGLLQKERPSLLIVSLPYGEQVPGCYLCPAHTIACYNDNLQELSPVQQVHVVLHEIGHLLYFQALKRESLLKEYTLMLARLSPLLAAKKIDLRPLLQPDTKVYQEGFANLFAFTLMQQTPAGEALLGESYRVFGSEALSLLNDFFCKNLFHTDSPCK